MRTKKIIPLAIILFMSLNIIPSISFAAESSLIQNVQMSLKDAENPKRLEVIFNLTEPIDLSQGNSDIIYEYFMKDSNGKFVAMQYKKDKSWSGYLNSYDNYPSGEHKYSSAGTEQTSYSDNVPATNIYTSIKTGSSIDVMLVAAVRITVFRADGSGEKVTVYSDGTVPDIEKIVIPVGDEDADTGIRLESSTTELPADTVLVAHKLTSGSIYEKIIVDLVNDKDFIAFEIKLESGGAEIQPNGKVKISIPIPENFDSSNLAAYRFDNDETKTLYSVLVITKDGAKYATLETEHFSTYVLVKDIEDATVDIALDSTAGIIADSTIDITSDSAVDITTDTTIDITSDSTVDTTKKEAEKDETPKTGTSQTIYYIGAITIISALGIAGFHKKQKGK